MTVNSETTSVSNEVVNTPENNENTQTALPVEQETQEQINWKKARAERLEQEKLAREAQERAAQKAAEAEALKAALDAVLNKPQPQYDQYNNQDDDEEKKLEQKLERLLQQREEKSRREREEEERRQLPQKLSSTYGDFNDVCSSENLHYVEYHYPEIAKAIECMPEGFDKYSTIYKTIKRFVPNTNSQKDIKKIDQNLSKPQSMNSGLSSTSDTTPHIMLDDERKKANWARMQRAKKGLT